MIKLTEQQITQVDNIIKTLVEATEHLLLLTKQREFSKGLYTFSSIIEGFQAVTGIINHFEDEELMIKKMQIEKNIIEMGSFFEQNNLLKVHEIIQFSFLPALNNVSKIIEAKQNKKDDKKIVIGVFHSFGNPRDFYPEPRVKALISESEKQHTELLFFTSKDVDFEKKEITADRYVNGKWERIQSKFPDVINNVGAGKRSHVERKLRRMIPFTSFHVGNKVSLPKRMLENRKYAELLVPFRICMSKEQIHDFIEKNNKTVFKALQSNRGENIFFVTKKGQRYSVLEHKKEQIMHKEMFDEWLEKIILEEKGSYIVQRYVHTRTKANEPYHFRAHVQKDGNGKWILTHIYPRVGSKKSNLSNVVNEGRVDDFHEFMMREFDENGQKYEKDILRLSIEIAMHLDKIYGFGLDELGIDLAIDENGKYWMHEANNGPQTFFHEEKRAVNTIAYAKYIAENGIFYSDNVRKSQTGMFQSNLSRLPLHQTSNKKVIGVLSGKVTDDVFMRKMAEEAEENDLSLYIFKPKDIDYDYMLIKGLVYENGEWIQKIAEYPDVIFDRLKLRGDSDANWIYEELSDIPFTNEWPVCLQSRSNIHEALSNIEELSGILISLKEVERTRDIFSALEISKKVFLKRNDWDLMGQIHINQISQSKYIVTEKGKEIEYNGLQLLNKLREDLKEHRYILHEDPRSTLNEQHFTLNTDIMLVEEQQWELLTVYAREESGKIIKEEDLSSYLQSIIEENSVENILTEMENLSNNVASSLRIALGDSVSTLSMTFAVDDNNNLKLIEANPSGSNIIPDVQALSEGIIKRANWLLKNEMK